MKTITSSTKSGRISIGIIALLALGSSATMTDAQEVTVKPVTDVREVMREHALIAEVNLWPGFNLKEIPVAVYDSVNTWLFFADHAPEGFRKADHDTGVFVLEGQYPLVRGNSVVRFGETWTATSILSNSSRRTGERYNSKDLAGIIVHEQFHVFQRIKHPGWRQNDGVLLFYPEETKEALFLRRIEKEAFKRAVLATDKKEITGWALTALDYRKERLDMVPVTFGNYERDLQRTEGLSDHIERISRGVDPLNASNMTNGIAPAGVRDLGYWEGRWIAMILDRLNPDWKVQLESNDTLFLEEILESAMMDPPLGKQTFSEGEISQLRLDSDKIFDEWQFKKSEEIESYENLPGYSLEISSISSPLNIRIFEPLEIELLPERAVFHRLIFSAANQKGNIRIFNHPCITYFDESFRLVKLCIYGLPEAPEVITEEKKLILKYGDISLELNYSELTLKGADYHMII
ncbi:MAG: hypothetical protein U5L72_05850 [Bacteroidales bacterium]|nr:hypothetical protein [Bacteroidales bacterium]